MISVPTVLVLGAGASKPYKYPLGQELVTNICDNLSRRNSDQCKTMQNCFNWNEINSFRKSLLFSGKNSVDGFLEHRKEFIDIGKTAIAFTAHRN